MRISRGLSLLAAIFLSSIAGADVALPTLFGDHAVFQRDTPVPVWGTASPGESVTVSFNGQSRSTTADGAGDWMVILDRMAANTSPGPLTVTGDNLITLQSVHSGPCWRVWQRVYKRSNICAYGDGGREVSGFWICKRQMRVNCSRSAQSLD